MSLRSTLRYELRRALSRCVLWLLVGCTGVAQAASPSSMDNGPSGEVEVFGDRGIQISVDGGATTGLPLSSPLSLSAGKHVITATQGRMTLTSQVEVRAGRALEVRFNFNVQAVSVTIPPHALLLEQYQGIPKAAETELAVTTVRGLSKQRLTLLSPARDTILPSDCHKQIPCLVAQAQQQEADYTVVLSVAALPKASGESASDLQNYQIIGQIIDRSVESEASSVTDSCTSCSITALQDKLRQILPELASSALSRTKGILRIQTEPSQAEIFANGVRLGTSPLHRKMWASTIDLRAVLPGHQPIAKRVVISANADTDVTLTLEPDQQEPAEVRKRRVIVIGQKVEVLREPRPRWRLIAGGAGIGVGALLIGFGSGALAVDGTCIRPPMGAALHCDSLYSTFNLGTGLVAAGSAIAIGGILTMAWPGRVIPQPSPPSQGASK